MQTQEVVREKKDGFIDSGSMSKEVATRSTVEYAIDLVTRGSNFNFEDFRVKGLGLQLAMLGIAEHQATRLNSLSQKVIDLEERIFKPEVLNDLTAYELVMLYKQAGDNVLSMSNHIRIVLGQMDWTKLEADLITMATKSVASDIDEDTKSIAEEIARHLAAADSKKNTLLNMVENKNKQQ